MQYKYYYLINNEKIIKYNSIVLKHSAKSFLLKAAEIKKLIFITYLRKICFISEFNISELYILKIH